jgi:hypothetical protein
MLQIESQRIASFPMKLDELKREYMWDPDRESFTGYVCAGH